MINLRIPNSKYQSEDDTENNNDQEMNIDDEDTTDAGPEDNWFQKSDESEIIKRDSESED